MSKIVLVTGGTRSGKSLFAEEYAAKHGKKIAYIATAQIFDKEMEHRVALHQKRRPNDWYTFEAPYDAHATIEKISSEFDMLLFDCLTIYTSNLMFQAESQALEDQYEYIEQNITKLLDSLKGRHGTIVFVTNEVGMGIVPSNDLSRQYRDLAGIVNQKLASVATQVFLVVCGIPIDIKKLAINLNEED